MISVSRNGKRPLSTDAIYCERYRPFDDRALPNDCGKRESSSLDILHVSPTKPFDVIPYFVEIESCLLIDHKKFLQRLVARWYRADFNISFWSVAGVKQEASRNFHNICHSTRMSTTTNRSRLPFREKTEVFMVTKSGQVVAQDRSKYLQFPGGGVDPGENIMSTARREVMEETGLKVVGLKHLVTVDWVWFPAWADNDKRRERYDRFQGERVHILVGLVDSRSSDLSREEDAWKGRKTMSIKRCINLVKKYGAMDHVNTYAYRIAQVMALHHLSILKPS